MTTDLKSLVKPVNAFTSGKTINIGASNLYLWLSDKERFIKTVVNQEPEKYEFTKHMARGVFMEDLLKHMLGNADKPIITEAMLLIDGPKYKTWSKDFKRYCLDYTNLATTSIQAFVKKYRDWKLYPSSGLDLHIGLNGLNFRIRGIPDIVLSNGFETHCIELKTTVSSINNTADLCNKFPNVVDYANYYAMNLEINGFPKVRALVMALNKTETVLDKATSFGDKYTSVVSFTEDYTRSSEDILSELCIILNDILNTLFN